MNGAFINFVSVSDVFSDACFRMGYIQIFECLETSNILGFHNESALS